MIAQALEALTAQGVLRRTDGPSGAEYEYVAPERYVQAGMDVVRDPAKRANRKPR
ncbi:hypothetical protein D3C83_326640 [compost metagenome]